MDNTAFEVNFDGIVGPTHNFSGLSWGNIASVQSKELPSNPKQAALQGLEKMKFLADLGIKQAVLPPQERPYLPLLREIGFAGTDQDILARVYKDSPQLLAACSSASSMWTANAATVSPSCDSIDGKVHFTPANLISKFHRSIEPKTTSRMLRAIFEHPHYFTHHESLPASSILADEGAANHTRFCKDFGKPGLQLFVYGRQAFQPEPTKIYPARQTLEASQAIARIHQLVPSNVVFAQQNPGAIDAGVFHNDVISVGHRSFFFYHQGAFANTAETLAEIAKKIQKTCGVELQALLVDESEVSLKDAVSTYLFNSQFVTLEDDSLCMLAPIECQQNKHIHQFLQHLLKNSGNPIKHIHYLNVRESMSNGGGPACLRLRVVLTPKELAAVNPHVFLDNALYQQLTGWVKRHYRDRLVASDLADPQLLLETRKALDELTKILGLDSLYEFQS